MHELNFSLQANCKTREGDRHPDREAQFCYINDLVKTALIEQPPVISVDTKKKEWRPKGQPEAVRVHDFLIKELGRAVPYGIYDLAADHGWVSVGMDHDTAAFAVQTILPAHRTGSREPVKRSGSELSSAWALYPSAPGKQI